MVSSIFEQDYDVFVDTLETALKSHMPLQTLPQKSSICQEALRLKNTKLREGISVPGGVMIGNNIHICKNSLRALTKNLRQS